jgi:single-stranded-DNA-specific exonuclease
VDVLSSKIVGGNHRQMQLRQTSGRTGKTFRAIHFNAKTDPPLKNSFEQIIFRLDWNRWNGKKTKQIMIEDTETFTI